MLKYKQKYIPSVSIVEYDNLSRYVRQEYSAHVQGKTVINHDCGLTIYFGSDGKAELAHGRAIYAKKAALVQCLPQLMEVAEYNNWGQRKQKDPKSVFGYANFKAKAKVNGEIVNVRISVIVKSNGKAYYHHELSIKKMRP